VAKHRAQCPECGHHFEIDPAVDRHIQCPACGQGLALPSGAAPSLAGRRLGDYEVLELLGRGAMGEVYRARQLSLDRPVALKILSGDVSADGGFIERFTREARAAAAVSHPNIIEVYAIGEEAGHQFIAMELVDGESLTALLTRAGRLSAEQALRVLKGIASALAKAHAAGICHRDIKPANILLAADGRPKLADFGVARRDRDEPQGRFIVGTAPFMAPEVAIGEPADARSDLYSLGATAYTMLAGKPPFHGRTLTELAVRQAEGPPPDLAGLCPDAPPALCRVIHRLLERHPDRRYQNATDLLAALDRVAPAAAPRAASRPPTAAGTRPVPARGTRRGLPLVIGAACGAVALVTLVVVLGAGRWRREAEPEVVIVPGTDVAPPKTDVPVTPREAPPWAKPLAEAEASAKRLAAEGRFAEAIASYRGLLLRFHDDLLANLVNEALEALRQRAGEDCAGRERRARDLLARGQFDDARAAIAPVAEGHGIPELAERVAALGTRIDEAETLKTEADAHARAEAEREAREKAERERRRLAERAFARAVEPVDTLLTAWRFEAAGEALAKVAVEDESLAQRLAARRDQAARLARLKAAVIARINGAQPRLTKRDLLIPGINGAVTRAAADVIHTIRPDGRAETHPWGGLSTRSVQKLIELAVDPARADDWVAAGLLATACGSAEDAEGYLAKARELGADVERFRDPLAAAAFAQAKALLDKQQLDAALAALGDLVKRFADTPWLAANSDAVAEARRRAQTARREADAEKLYAAAAAFYKAGRLFDLMPLVDKLQKDFADTAVVRDAARQPSAAEMAKAVAKLKTMVTVAADGTAQHVVLQKAIDAAKPGDTIMILDDAIYNERLLIPRGKKGIRLLGKPGKWPILSARVGPERQIRRLVDVKAPDVTFEGLVFAVHKVEGRSGPTMGCIYVDGKPVTVRSCIFYCEGSYGRAVYNYNGRTTLDHCVFTTRSEINGATAASNCVWLHYSIRLYGSTRQKSSFTNCVLHRVYASTACAFRTCTITGRLDLNRGPNVVRDSIVRQVDADEPDLELDYCCVFGRPGYSDFARPGPHCFTKNPQFLDMEEFDFRLRSVSPCRGKASDGGDIGCRLTPQMREMLKLAYALRRRGVIAFTSFGKWDPDWLD